MSIATTGYKLEYVSRDLICKFIKALMSTFRAVVFMRDCGESFIHITHFFSELLVLVQFESLKLMKMLLK